MKTVLKTIGLLFLVTALILSLGACGQRAAKTATEETAASDPKEIVVETAPASPTPTPTPAVAVTTVPMPMPSSSPTVDTTNVPEPTPSGDSALVNGDPNEPEISTTAPELPPEGSKRVYINGGGVNFRSGPATTYDVIDTFYKNDMVYLIESSENGWSKVYFEGTTGYVYTKFISYNYVTGDNTGNTIDGTNSSSGSFIVSGGNSPSGSSIVG